MATAVQSEQSWWSGGKSPYSLSYGKLMMWFFLMSDSFTFGALLISLWSTRFSLPSWPDPNQAFKAVPFFEGTNLPLVYVSFMTFVLILSSVTMVMAVNAGHRMDKKGAAMWLGLTIVGGLIFLGSQAWEWTHLWHEGAWWGRNPFPNMDGTVASTAFTNYFFTVTGFHGFHVFSGIVINCIILINILKGTYERRGHYEMVEKVGLYWHFVDLVWVFVFTCYYLL